MVKRTQITIVGGGIGGLTAAVSLGRKGFETQILERAPDYRHTGSGITVQINAMLALKHIGLSDAIISRGNSIDRLSLRLQCGRQLFATDTAKFAHEFGVPFIGIRRADLQQVLLQAAKETDVRMGFRTKTLELNEPGATVISEEDQRIESEAVIGADGLRSIVRESLWGEDPPRYSGYTSWRGIIHDCDLVGKKDAVETWGNDSVFGTIPLSGGSVYWYVTHRCGATQVDKSDPRETILNFVHKWHAPIEKIVGSTNPELIVRTDVFDRAPRFPWGMGGVTLLGDAAHPMTPNLGQGGCQAIEDAVVLAESLDNANTIEAGLRHYERMRYRRCRRMVRLSRAVSDLSHKTNLVSRMMRRSVFPFLPRYVRDRQFRSIFSFNV